MVEEKNKESVEESVKEQEVTDDKEGKSMALKKKKVKEAA